SRLYTLSLHDALPISTPSSTPRSSSPVGCGARSSGVSRGSDPGRTGRLLLVVVVEVAADRAQRGGVELEDRLLVRAVRQHVVHRSEEHTSELQSRENL